MVEALGQLAEISADKRSPSGLVSPRSSPALSRVEGRSPR